MHAVEIICADAHTESTNKMALKPDRNFAEKQYILGATHMRESDVQNWNC